MPSRFVSVPNVFFELHCAAGIMRLALVITALAGSGSIAQIQAAPITYMLTSAGSGTLGGSSFTNATVMVTLTCDTSGVTAGTGSQAGYLVNSGTATVTVSGVGTATFTDPVEIVSTYNSIFDGVNAVLIGDSVSGTGILLQEGTVFSGYQLGPLGPVTGSGGVASGSSMTPVFPTTAGNFTWAIGQAFGNLNLHRHTGGGSAGEQQHRDSQRQRDHGGKRRRHPSLDAHLRRTPDGLRPKPVPFRADLHHRLRVSPRGRPGTV